MLEELLISLTIIIVLSISAQWLAWRLKLPSILLLLLFGILAGPATHLIDVDETMGDLLFPAVSLAVAIILFEGGLSLRLADLREIGHVVRNLVTIGVLISWIITTIAARYVLELEWDISFLVGAILVVTGPTVVIPLLNQIRPASRVSSILRWEGIAIDPVGAVLTVLVFEQILEENARLEQVLIGVVVTIIIGGVLGFLSAELLIEAFRRYWVPDNLQNPVVLMTIFLGLTVSNVIQPESGLLTVTIMGIVMANQKRFDVLHIVEFKENLQILLISSIFILLGARLEFETLTNLGGGIVIFIGIMMLVTRPLTVWISAWGSPLNWREKLFVAWMAPRGIVAASVASIFAIELAQHNHEGAEVLVPITFSVIIATVVIYGLTAGIVANRLHLVQEHPQGIFIIGAHRWARKMSLAVKELGFKVILIDSNIHNINHALSAGLQACHGDVLTDAILDEVDFSGVGRMIAMTPNDEVNSLASLHFKNVFGEDQVYQLPNQFEPAGQESLSLKLGGKDVFGPGVTYDYLAQRFNRGAEIVHWEIENPQAVMENLDVLTPLFVKTTNDRLLIWKSEMMSSLRPGQILVALVEPGFDFEKERQALDVKLN